MRDFSRSPGTIHGCTDRSTLRLEYCPPIRLVTIGTRDRPRERVPLNRPSSLTSVVENSLTTEARETHVALFNDRSIDDYKWVRVLHSINQLLQRFTQSPNVGLQLLHALPPPRNFTPHLNPTNITSTSYKKLLTGLAPIEKTRGSPLSIGR